MFEGDDDQVDDNDRDAVGVVVPDSVKPAERVIETDDVTDGEKVALGENDGVIDAVAVLDDVCVNVDDGVDDGVGVAEPQPGFAHDWHAVEPAALNWLTVHAPEQADVVKPEVLPKVFAGPASGTTHTAHTPDSHLDDTLALYASLTHHDASGSRNH